MDKELNKSLGYAFEMFAETFEHGDYTYNDILSMSNDEETEEKNEEVIREFFAYAYSEFFKKVAEDFMPNVSNSFWNVEVNIY